MCIFKGHLAYCTFQRFMKKLTKTQTGSYQVKGIEVYDYGPTFTWQLIHCLAGLLKTPNLLRLPTHRVQS